MYCVNRLHFLVEVGFCHVHMNDNGKQGDIVDVVPQTSTAKSTIKIKKNRAISSATTKIIPTLLTHGVFGMPLLHPRGANHLVEG